MERKIGSTGVIDNNMIELISKNYPDDDLLFFRTTVVLDDNVFIYHPSTNPHPIRKVTFDKCLIYWTNYWGVCDCILQVKPSSKVMPVGVMPLGHAVGQTQPPEPAQQEETSQARGLDLLRVLW